MERKFKPCSILSCGQNVFGRGWCGKHWARWRRHGDPMYAARVHAYAEGEKCSVPDCPKDVRELRMCSAHAQRVKTHGSPYYLTPEHQRRANNRKAQVARTVGKTLSAYPKLNGRHEHRIIAEQILGRPLLKGEIVHHIDRNRRNNNPSNLQIMTQSEHVNLHRRELEMALLKSLIKKCNSDPTKTI